MTNYKNKLPKAVEMHFQATNTDDPETFLSIFAEHAVVMDAGNEYHGKPAIKEWCEREYFGVHLRLEVINAVQVAKEIVVTAKCDGDYIKAGLPDPLFLDFHFSMDGDKIARLCNVISSNSRAIPLPQPVAAFYYASDIFDERKTYYGPKAVSGYILEANRSANVMTEIINCIEKSGETVVAVIISGDFDGSPVPLDFHFTLNEDKIKKLDIMVAGE